MAEEGCMGLFKIDRLPKRCFLWWPESCRRVNTCCNSDSEHRVQKLCQEGRLNDAIHFVKHIVHEATTATRLDGTYLCLLKACAGRKTLTEGKQVHALMAHSKCDSNVFLANTLIHMYYMCGSLPDAFAVFCGMPQHNVFSWTAIISAYAKCGCVGNARELFNKMGQRSVASWNAMIAGYAKSGLGKEALVLYEKMQQEGLQADKVTFVCALKACAAISALEKGKLIHSVILERGFHLDITVQSTLIDMYAKCGCLEDARNLFDQMSERNVVSWTAMISGYAQNGLGREALVLYEQMKHEGLQPNKVTFVSVLKACANTGALEQGKEIHSLVLQKGFGLDIIIQSVLVDMYAKCGYLENARELFNSISKRNVVTWNTMIAGYAQNGLGEEALVLYEEMKREGVPADKVTYICVLKACANIGALEQGKMIHSLILDKGFYLDVAMQSTLLDMYAKCGCLQDARELFNNMNDRNVVSWTAMIAGYAQNGHGKEALALYEQMKQDGMEANEATYICLLKACASIGALEQGKQIHTLILEKGFSLDVFVQNTLIDMYVKCGCLKDARELFSNMNERNVISFNAMISGYSYNGLGEEVLALYEQMKLEGIHPDDVTYTFILSVCGYSGLVKEGFHVFDFIYKHSSVIPTLKHYNCIVDLLGRVGLLAEAEDFVTKMPIQPDSAIWMSLLYAARNVGNAEIGQHAFSYLVKLEPENAAPYLLLIDIYAAVGWIEKVAKMRQEMIDRDLKRCLTAAELKLMTKGMPVL